MRDATLMWHVVWLTITLDVESSGQ